MRHKCDELARDKAQCHGTCLASAMSAVQFLAQAHTHRHTQTERKKEIYFNFM